jgi:hypothetical protein
MIDEMSVISIITLEKQRLLNLALGEGLDLTQTKQLETYIKLELLMDNKPTDIVQNNLDNMSNTDIINILDQFKGFPQKGE